MGGKGGKDDGQNHTSTLRIVVDAETEMRSQGRKRCVQTIKSDEQREG
jgi:hypothetical protein